MITTIKKWKHDKLFPAMLDGSKLTAQKAVGGEWLVGGDFTLPTQSVSIATRTKKTLGRLAWHTLKGNRLVFDDFVGSDEDEKQLIEETIGVRLQQLKNLY